MEWSNEKVLEFLEQLQSEACLWDPKHPTHKNRSVVSGAWRRISQSLSFSVTTDELKKKKESLMGYYRIHLNKYKTSLKSGAGLNDVYKTNWFAFDLMNSFLRPIYGTKSVINTESVEEYTNESARASTSTTTMHTNEPSTLVSNRPNSETFKRSQNHKYKTPPPPEILYAKKQMDKAMDRLDSLTSQKRELDEYDHFGCMIASKVRKLNNLNDREVLMNSIQNIMFEFFMNNQQSNVTMTQSSNVQSSPMYQYDEENNDSPQIINNIQYSQAYEQLSQRPSTPSNDALQHLLSISESGPVTILSDETIIIENHHNN